MAKLKERDIVCADVLQQRGESVRAIARKLSVDESTLRYRLGRVRRSARDGRADKAEACDPHAELIAAWIGEQADARRPESVKALYETLVSEHGYCGGYKAVLRYVRRRSATPAIRPSRRVETRPGAQAQVDWATTRLEIGTSGRPLELSAFVLTLSWSRLWVVLWALKQDLLSWVGCHNRALSRLEGVPASLRIDNLKTGVASGAGPWAVLQPGYASYAEQMGFVVDPCRVRSPSDKGKVERRIRDVKWLQVREGERFASIEALQETTDARIAERAERLVCPVTGQSVRESFELERVHLRPLPEPLPTPFDVQVSRVVRRDATVSFEGRHYSVPFALVGRSVSVRGCETTVEIYSGVERVATFPRHTACRSLIDQAHYEGPSTDEITAPVPLGEIGRQIVLSRSWEASHRSIDVYEAAVRRTR
jgi:transposase